MALAKANSDLAAAQEKLAGIKAKIAVRLILRCIYLFIFMYLFISKSGSEGLVDMNQRILLGEKPVDVKSLCAHLRIYTLAKQNKPPVE